MSFVVVVDWSTLEGICAHRITIQSFDLLINIWLVRDLEAVVVFICTKALLISFIYTFYIWSLSTSVCNNAGKDTKGRSWAQLHPPPHSVLVLSWFNISWVVCILCPPIFQAGAWLLFLLPSKNKSFLGYLISQQVNDS